MRVRFIEGLKYKKWIKTNNYSFYGDEEEIMKINIFLIKYIEVQN